MDTQSKIFGMPKSAVTFGAIGLVIGAILGVPASYLLQPGLLRMFMPIGEYVVEFGSLVLDPDFAFAAFLGVAAMAATGAVAGAITGLFVAKRSVGSS